MDSLLRTEKLPVDDRRAAIGLDEMQQIMKRRFPGQGLPNEAVNEVGTKLTYNLHYPGFDTLNQAMKTYQKAVQAVETIGLAKDVFKTLNIQPFTDESVQQYRQEVLKPHQDAYRQAQQPVLVSQRWSIITAIIFWISLILTVLIIVGNERLSQTAIVTGVICGIDLLVWVVNKFRMEKQEKHLANLWRGWLISPIAVYPLALPYEIAQQAIKLFDQLKELPGFALEVVTFGDGLLNDRINWMKKLRPQDHPQAWMEWWNNLDEERRRRYCHNFLVVVINQGNKQFERRWYVNFWHEPSFNLPTAVDV